MTITVIPVDQLLDKIRERFWSNDQLLSIEAVDQVLKEEVRTAPQSAAVVAQLVERDIPVDCESDPVEDGWHAILNHYISYALFRWLEQNDLALNDEDVRRINARDMEPAAAS